MPDTLPDQLAWCGSDAVLLFWEGLGGLLVTLAGGWRWWDLGGGAAAFAPEVDGQWLFFGGGLDAVCDQRAGRGLATA